MRASQINGCAYCIDLHADDARKAGESERRLTALSVWRETPLYSERERAALEWTEYLTRVAEKLSANIQKGEDFSLLQDAIRSSRNTYGMQSFDHSLLQRFKSGVITQDEALEPASNRKNLELALQGFKS